MKTDYMEPSCISASNSVLKYLDWTCIFWMHRRRYKRIPGESKSNISLGTVQGRFNDLEN